MSPKPLPIYAILPSIVLPIRPLPPPPTDPDSEARNSNAPSNTDNHIIPANQDDMDHPDDSIQEEQHILANQADMDDPDDHDQEEQHPVSNNNVPETPSKFAAIGLERMALASPIYRPARARTTGDDRESYLDYAMRAPGPDSSLLREIGLRQEHSARYPRRDRNEAERRHPPPRTINAIFNRFAEDDTYERERRHAQPPPRRIVEEDVGSTRTRNTRAVTPPVQTPTSRMPPPQTPASRMPPPQMPASRTKVPQSPASRLLKRITSPVYVVRSTGTHDGVSVTPSVVRSLFPSPSPRRNISEFQLVHPLDPLPQSRESRRRSVSFASAMDEDTAMASPSVATPKRPTGEKDVMTTPQSRTGETKKVITPDSQTEGSPPVPQTPRTPRIWISPSQITPAIEARMRARPVYEYRNPDEPMEMTPSPPKLELASPDDRKMEDAFWTPSKQATSNVAGFREKVAAGGNTSPMEHKSLMANSIPFGVAMAQDLARSQHVSPIGNPDAAQDGLSPRTTTMRTFISTEITTTIKTTPSPLQSLTPAPKPTDTRRRTAAKPQKTADAPRREVANKPQRKGKGGTEPKKNQGHSAKPIIPGGINRRQELRTEPRYSLRNSTRDIMPGTYSMAPARNGPFCQKVKRKSHQ